MSFTGPHLPVSESTYSVLSATTDKISALLLNAKLSTCTLSFTSSHLLKNDSPETDPPCIINVSPLSSVHKHGIISPILATFLVTCFSCQFPAHSLTTCYCKTLLKTHLYLLSLITRLLFSLKPIPIRLHQNCLYYGHKWSPCCQMLQSIVSPHLNWLSTVFRIVCYFMSSTHFLPLDSRITHFLGFSLSSLIPPSQIHLLLSSL